MRPESEYEKKVMWVKGSLPFAGIRAGIINLNGVQTHLCVGRNEDGWEHVSAEFMAKRLPTWNEMCFIKDMFWGEEEEVVQIHPRKSDYVNITDALHLWRPVNGDWSIMNHGGE